MVDADSAEVRCYFLSDQELPFEKAQQSCRDKNERGHLVVITSNRENIYIKTLM